MPVHVESYELRHIDPNRFLDPYNAKEGEEYVIGQFVQFQVDDIKRKLSRRGLCMKAIPGGVRIMKG